MGTRRRGCCECANKKDPELDPLPAAYTQLKEATRGKLDGKQNLRHTKDSDVQQRSANNDAQLQTHGAATQCVGNTRGLQHAHIHLEMETAHTHRCERGHRGAMTKARRRPKRAAHGNPLLPHPHTYAFATAQHRIQVYQKTSGGGPGQGKARRNRQPRLRGADDLSRHRQRCSHCHCHHYNCHHHYHRHRHYHYHRPPPTPAHHWLSQRRCPQRQP